MLEQIKASWEEILTAIRNDPAITTEVSYTTWIQPLKPIAENDGKLTLYFPGERLGIDYIEKKYKFVIIGAIKSVTNIKCDIDFSTSTTTTKNSSVITPTQANDRLNPKYTFDSFVVGNNNQLAHAAALAVAESPGEVYNPLFIYGGVGLGKTHLMQAIAHFILQNNPSANVIYVSSEEFTNELVDSIYQKGHPSTSSFHEKYRSVDVLIIDDIQFIARRERTQEEIFNTFNSLREANKAIIFASDRPPREIDNIDDRILSRFLSGFIADISLPDFETRMAILRKKEEIENYNIDNSVITYIANNIKSNIRELEGALTKIVGYSRLTTKEITLEIAQEALKEHITETSVQITPERVRELVADHFSISIGDLSSEKRSKAIAFPRQIAMYLSCMLTTSTQDEIATCFGKTDHGTVIYARDKIEENINTDPQLKNTIEVLKKKLSPSG